MPGASTLGVRARALTWIATLLVALLGVVCVHHERHALSGTFDEPNHLAAGLEWWELGTYSAWTENPPLARVAVAALPYLYGMRFPPELSADAAQRGRRIWQIGTDLLYGGPGFEVNLARARLGTLPFYVLVLVAAWGLAGGRRAAYAGGVAVGLTASLPCFIAHGALATTDVAFAGTFLLTVLALQRWFEAPSSRRALELGVAFGLALLSKFSALPFLAVVVPACLLARHLSGVPLRPLQRGAPLEPFALLGQLALAGFAGFLVTWAGYRFSIGAIGALPERVGYIQILPPSEARGPLVSFLLGVPVPMPELFHGLGFLRAHSQQPSNAYLFGQVSTEGFWYFYPVALAVKTPLPLLVLLPAAAWMLRKRRAANVAGLGSALGAVAILLLSMTSWIDLGIRHVFVVLPLAAVAVGHAVEIGSSESRGITRRTGAALCGALVLLQCGIALSARSRQLGYMNFFAGRDPGAVLLDSDLDWGQDLFALRRETEARGIHELSLAYFGMLHVCEHGLPPLEPLVPGRPTTGWVAISENFYRHRNYYGLMKEPCNGRSWYMPSEIPPEPFAWLRAYEPVTIVGTSIRLYHLSASQ